MFKGNLIENQKYYTLRSKELLFKILPSIAIGVFVNFRELPIWVTIGSIIFYLILMYFTVRNQREMLNLSTKRIEISQHSIELKESDGHLIEKIKIDEGVRLIVKEEYKMAQETMKDVIEEIKRNPEDHFLIVEIDNIQKRYDFVIESHYMLNQLNKLIRMWKQQRLVSHI